ncbi:F-actin-capping protein subunit alpha [Malassezia cuniculi]|uniref:F-actin-capping protein subunit alpha n=1 Tax=Malassezia cuniculi TaxID=948313 RepID=A0AAF0EP74_9BASI|nr:F-actin-capping protein subunit alpha [Malassezia cuniculi]
MASNTRDALLALLRKTPPGQFKNVYGDIKGILGAGDELADDVRAVAEQHSHEQLAVAQIAVDGADASVIVAEVARTPSGRYVSRRHGKSFAYDHVSEAASDVQPHEGHSDWAKSLDEQLVKYVEDHYENSASGVFVHGEVDSVAATAGAESGSADQAVTEEADHAEEPSDETAADPSTAVSGDNVSDGNSGSATADTDVAASVSNDVAASGSNDGAASANNDSATAASDAPVVICIVGNRYNLRNFWAGRWRSIYQYSPQSHKFTAATINVQVHYFENGNVQLNSNYAEIPQPKDGDVSSLIASIAAHEQAYQESLDQTIESLRDQAFRTLRRALPFTRQKIDWDKAVGYKLNSELQTRS